ncbi:hypothetical protein [Kaistella solincola]|uniref:hypothetical protein n=1 Tax=Kaistella solincola TaxID=510955 RepID=UPI000A8C3A28|nr:hypothetical protein [Kaistella solincola]
MKNITYKNLRFLLPKTALMAIAGSLFLASCTTTLGGYTETDGVYYDPSTDTLPEGMMNTEGNRIGEYYDYQANDDQNKYLNVENRNQRWQESDDSDWGNFTGTDTYYSNDSWSYPYGMFPGYGFGLSYGWGYGGYYSPWGFGYSPFSNYYGYNSPYYGYYNPYYGYYNPYGYGYYGGYNPYYSPYGYGYGYNSYNAPRLEYKRSGATNSFRDGNNEVRRSSNQTNGFRNNNQIYQNSTQQRNTQQPRYRTAPRTNDNQSSPRRQAVPQSYEPSYRNNSNDNSYRSSGRSGSFESGSSTRSSSSSSSRSGGFRR